MAAEVVGDDPDEVDEGTAVVVAVGISTRLEGGDADGARHQSDQTGGQGRPPPPQEPVSAGDTRLAAMASNSSKEASADPIDTDVSPSVHSSKPSMGE